MIKKAVIAIIIDLNEIYNTARYINYFFKLNELQSHNNYGYIIDTSNLFSINSKNLNYKFQPINKNQFFFQPKNIYELYKITKDIKCIGIFHLPNNINYLFKQLILKLFGVKRFAVSGLGYIGDNTIEKKSNISHKFRYFIEFRLGYFLFRFFQILGLFKQVDYFFEASQETIDQIERSFSKKIEKRIKFFKFSFYKKIYRINSYSYDRLLESKPSLNTNFIVLIDSGFDHLDRIKREGMPNASSREKYYLLLNNFLEEISKLLNKEVIICLHPKVEYIKCKNFEKIKKKYKTVVNKTEEFIYQADTCIFFESSAVITAIMLKKKIINLNSILMGPYYFKRNNIYDKHINFEKINLDNFQLPKNKIRLVSKLKNNIDTYEKYIQENIIYEENILSSDQIKNTLDKVFFNNKN